MKENRKAGKQAVFPRLPYLIPGKFDLEILKIACSLFILNSLSCFPAENSKSKRPPFLTQGCIK